MTIKTIPTATGILQKLKKDAKAPSANDVINVAKRAMCFYFNEYSIGYKIGKYCLYNGVEMKQGTSIFTDAEYVVIENEFKEKVGFICAEKEFIDTIGQAQFFNIWLWYCQAYNYENSLREFRSDNEYRIIELYKEYLLAKSIASILEIINKRSIGVKNMVLHIKNI